MNWTFGITTDDTQRDRVLSIIESVRQQNIPNDCYEVIVVGGDPIEAPSVVHISFDETQRNVWITKKKNLIGQTAKFNNIAIGHDYVAYQPDWYKNFVKFGEDWGTCMNRIENIDGSRYRDWILKGAHFVDYNDYSQIGSMYISGSYFCVKKQLLLSHPFDENLEWCKGEDVAWSDSIRHVWNYKMNQESVVRFLKNKPVI
jgi:hypothetical protein